MRISDWSSDVCSSDLPLLDVVDRQLERALAFAERARRDCQAFARVLLHHDREAPHRLAQKIAGRYANVVEEHLRGIRRSEERSEAHECVSTCRSRWSTFH